MTIAGPIWTIDGEQWNHGYSEHLRSKHLNEHSQLSGYGPPGILGEQGETLGVISTEERNPAYERGLVEAISKKATKSREEYALLVYANKYDEDLGETHFRRVVDSALSRAAMGDFGTVWVFSKTEGFCIKAI